MSDSSRGTMILYQVHGVVHLALAKWSPNAVASVAPLEDESAFALDRLQSLEQVTVTRSVQPAIVGLYDDESPIAGAAA